MAWDSDDYLFFLSVTCRWIQGLPTAKDANPMLESMDGRGITIDGQLESQD